MEHCRNYNTCRGFASSQNIQGGNYCLNCYPDEIKCTNFIYCQNQLDLLSDYQYCLSCRIFNFHKFNSQLQIINCNEDDQECGVCLKNVKRKIKLPQCHHYLCISCFKNVFHCDETRYHLDPVPFGCPQCPNNCINPRQGTQCYCYEYDEIQKNWEHNFPNDFKRWNDLEHFAIDNSFKLNQNYQVINDNSIFGDRKCPYCRTQYV